MQEETTLIQQAKTGDQLALSKLLQQNYSFLVKYLIKITYNPNLAEDLAQETIMKAIEKLRLYNGASKFSSWLITIGSNLYIDYKRKQKREKKWTEQEQALRKISWQYAQVDEDFPEVMEILGKMSEEMRVPIVLKHYYGYTLEEISDMLKIPVGTVKSRIHNGLNNIRKELNHEGAKEYEFV